MFSRIDALTGLAFASEAYENFRHRLLHEDVLKMPVFDAGRNKFYGGQ